MLKHPAPGLTAMVDRLSAFAPDPYGVALRDAAGGHLTCVMFKTHHGEILDVANLREALEFGAAQAHVSLGHRIATWGFLEPDQSAMMQAKTAVKTCAMVEDWHHWPRGTVAYGANDEIQGRPNFARSFVLAFRALAPLRQAFVVPLGLGFKGGDGQWYPADVNLTPYRVSGFRDLAETFDGAMRLQDVEGVLRAHRLYFGAPVPLFPGTTASLPQWIDSLERAKRAGAYLRGAGVFPAERLGPSDWWALGRALRDREMLG